MSKLKQRFEDVCDGEFDQNLTQTDFCAILANCKLLQADFPRTDERWVRFYSKFIVVDEQGGDEESFPLATKRGSYQLIPALISLITLSQGPSDIKAKAICELYSGQ